MKTQIVQAVILARGLHLAGTWPALRPAESKKLNRAVVDALRPLANLDGYVKRASDEAVVTHLGALFPERMVTLMRLSVAVRVATHAPTELSALLRQEGLRARGCELWSWTCGVWSRPRYARKCEETRCGNGLRYSVLIPRLQKRC